MPLDTMDPRPPAMHYDASDTAHTNGYELEVLADLASHHFDDLESAHTSPGGWRRPGAHSSASGTLYFPLSPSFLLNRECFSKAAAS